MTPAEMENRLLEIVDTLYVWKRANPGFGNPSTFPFLHTYNGAGVPTLQAENWLVPAGYLKNDVFRDGTGKLWHDHYSFSRAGFELIRSKLPGELREQGDKYYGVEANL